MSVEISGLICLWGCSSFSCLLYIQIWDSQKQSPPQCAGMRRGRGRCVCGQRRACQPCLHDRAASTTSSCAFGGEWRPAPHRQEAPSQGSSEVGDRWSAVKHKGVWSGYRAPDAENQAAGSLDERQSIGSQRIRHDWARTHSFLPFDSTEKTKRRKLKCMRNQLSKVTGQWLLFFFFSWFVYWCFNHLLSESERMKRGTGLELSLSLAPEACQNFFQNLPTVDFLKLRVLQLKK